MSKPKIICPRCGAEMNHHANKVDYGADEESSGDAAFDGVVEEVHTCPQCGYVGSRLV